jgi:hypothetical protein
MRGVTGSYHSVIFELESHYPACNIDFRFENVFGRITESLVRKIVDKHNTEKRNVLSLTDLCHRLALLCEETM